MKNRGKNSSLVVGIVLVLLVGIGSVDAAGECDNWQINNPEWLLCDDFENGYSSLWNTLDTDSVLTSNITEAYDGTSAKVTAHLGGGGDPNFVFNPVPNLDEIYVRYYINIDSGSDWPHHMGGITAIASGYGPSAGTRPNGNEAYWSSLEPMSVNFQGGRYFGFYSYWQEQRSWLCVDGSTDPSCSGYNGPSSQPYYGNSFVPVGTQVEKDRWYCIEATLKANTPGQYDGSQIFWVDDQVVGDYSLGSPLGNWVRDSFYSWGPYYSPVGPFEGYNWRTDPNLKIGRIQLEWYHSSTQAPTDIVYYDNVVVSKERIGCVLQGPCSLTGASWGQTSVINDTQVSLNVEGVNCWGSLINFSIYEDDTIVDDFILQTQDTFSSTTWITVWNYTQNMYGAGMPENNDDDVGNGSRSYYFVATVANNASESFTSGFLEVNKTPIVPIYSFYDGTTTNFSAEANMSNVINAILEKTNFGKIDFGVQGLDFTSANLDKYVFIENESIGINTNVLSNLGSVPAIITFYNILYANPIVLRGGVVCLECVISSYVSGNLEVSVPGFSNYTVTSGIEVDSTYGVPYNKSNLIDGNTDAFDATTQWASEDGVNPGPHWVAIYFSSPQTIENVTLWWADNSGTYTTSQQVYVQYWNGTDYQTIDTINDVNDVSSFLNFTPVSTTSLRLWQDVNQGAVGYNSIMWMSEIDFGIVDASCSEGAIGSQCTCGVASDISVGLCCNIANDPVWFDPYYGSCPIGPYFYINNGVACDDTNPGTEAKPWCTVNKATDTLTAGQVALIKEGYYDVGFKDFGGGNPIPVADPVNSGTPSNPIIYRSYPLDNVTIVGDPKPIGAYQDSNIIWDGFNVRSTTLATALRPWEEGAVVIRDSINITIMNSDLKSKLFTTNNHVTVALNGANGSVIRNNKIHGSKGPGHNTAGIMMYWSNDNLFENNEIYDTWTGIFNKGGISDRNIFRYNKIYDVNEGILIGSSTKTYDGEKYYQNIIYNTSIYSWAIVTFNNDLSHKNRSFFNNVFADSNENSIWVPSPSPGTIMETPENYSFYNNIYLNSSSRVFSIGIHNGGVIEEVLFSNFNNFNNYNFFSNAYGATLGLWQTQTGFDLNSTEVDPQFVDSANRDYHLQPTSPLINAGLDIYDLDNDGQTNDPINMGAYITGNEIIGIIDYGLLSAPQALVVGTADVNNDGKVNVIDLSLAVFNQGNIGNDYSHLDVNGDSNINLLDFIEIMLNFG